MKAYLSVKGKIIWTAVYTLLLVSLWVFLKLKFADFFSSFPSNCFVSVFVFSVISVLGFAMIIGLIQFEKRRRNEYLHMGVGLLILGLLYSTVGFAISVMCDSFAVSEPLNSTTKKVMIITFFVLYYAYLFSCSFIVEKEPPMMCILTIMFMAIADIVLVTSNMTYSFYVVAVAIHFLTTLFIILMPEWPSDAFVIISNVLIGTIYFGLLFLYGASVGLVDFIKKLWVQYPIWINLIAVAFVGILIYGVIHIVWMYIKSDAVDGKVWSGISLTVTSLLYLPAIYTAYSGNKALSLFFGLTQIVWLFVAEFMRKVFDVEAPILTIASASINIVWLLFVVGYFKLNAQVVFLVLFGIRFVFVMLATWLPDNMPKKSYYSSSSSDSYGGSIYGISTSEPSIDANFDDYGYDGTDIDVSDM